MSDATHEYGALLRRTQALLDGIPDLIFRLDRQARYLDFHAFDESHLAFRPEDFLGHTVSETFGPEIASTTQCYIAKALSTGEVQTWEYPLDLRGEPRDFEARFVPAGDDDVVAIIRDITEAKAVARQLQASERRLNEAENIARIGSWERDLRTGVVWWSAQTYRLLEFDPKQVVPSFEGFLDRVHPQDRRYLCSMLDGAIESGKSYSVNLRVVSHDRSVRRYHDRAVVVQDAGGKPIRLIGTLQDVTEQFELERALVSAGERERNRIGQDLHDGLGQMLAAVILKLKLLGSAQDTTAPRVKASIADLAAELEAAIAEMRRVTELLSPSIAGLGKALEALVHRTSSQLDIRIAVGCSAVHEIHDENVEIQLYRIAQEALGNAIKHSRASDVELTFVCDGERISLRVADDGIGIPPTCERREGLGLGNMEHRARAINGHLQVQTLPAGGTVVTCVCPCH